MRPNAKLPDPGKYNYWQDWARDAVKAADRSSSMTAVAPQVVLLEHLTSIPLQSIAADGLVMYDPVRRIPVFSRDGVWLPFTAAPA